MDNKQFDKINELKGIYDDIEKNYLPKVTPSFLEIVCPSLEKIATITLSLGIARYGIYAYMEQLKKELKGLGYEV